jgi:hypothetical protein
VETPICSKDFGVMASGEAQRTAVRTFQEDNTSTRHDLHADIQNGAIVYGLESIVKVVKEDEFVRLGGHLGNRLLQCKSSGTRHTSWCVIGIAHWRILIVI